MGILSGILVKRGIRERGAGVCIVISVGEGWGKGLGIELGIWGNLLGYKGKVRKERDCAFVD